MSAHVHTHRAGAPTVQQRVHAQAAFIASAAFTVLLPLVLVTLAITSAWTGWVNVMAVHTYLDRPDALPGVTWAMPVAVQTFIIAGEATMVLNSILRRRWIMVSGAAATIAGYGAEVGAHVYYGGADDTTVTMLASAIACGGGWALVAGLMHRGVEIANGDATASTDAAREPDVTSVPGRPDQETSSARPDPDEPADTDQQPTAATSEAKAESAPTRPPRRRRTRAELLGAVRALAPDQPTLSPNFVATRVGVSWANAKSLLSEAGRLAVPKPTPQASPARR